MRRERLPSLDGKVYWSHDAGTKTSSSSLNTYTMPNSKSFSTWWGHG